MASSSSYNSPCAACKFLRRKCTPGCIFAPYFPPEEPQKFANVHKIFGASNVTKLLNELLPHQREDAVNSLAYEAEARVRDPVYGSVGAISYLQRQVQRLQKELDAANADLARYGAADCCEAITSTVPGVNPVSDPWGANSLFRPQGVSSVFHLPGGDGGGGGFVDDQQPPPAASVFMPYGSSFPWNGDHVSGGGREGNM